MAEAPRGNAYRRKQTFHQGGAIFDDFPFDVLGRNQVCAVPARSESCGRQGDSNHCAHSDHFKIGSIFDGRLGAFFLKNTKSKANQGFCPFYCGRPCSSLHRGMKDGNIGNPPPILCPIQYDCIVCTHATILPTHQVKCNRRTERG